jgi:hypothetical protein
MDVASIVIAILGGAAGLIGAITGVRGLRRSDRALALAEEANRIAADANAIAERGVVVQREAVASEQDRRMPRLEIDHASAGGNMYGAWLTARLNHLTGDAARKVRPVLLLGGEEWEPTSKPPNEAPTRPATIEPRHSRPYRFVVGRDLLTGPTGIEVPEQFQVHVAFEDAAGNPHESRSTTRRTSSRSTD